MRSLKYLLLVIFVVFLVVWKVFFDTPKENKVLGLVSPTVAVTLTVTEIASPSAEITPTATPSATPTATPSATLTASMTATRSATPTKKPTPTPTKIKPSPTPSPELSEEVNKYIDRFAAQYGVDANVIRHIALCESGFNSRATNGPYAGLFQFGETTWKNIRKEIGEDINPELRYAAKDAVQTAAYAVSKGKGGMWPNCFP